jgi:hypothetical protein
MNDAEGFGANQPNDPSRRATKPVESHPRAVGSPLPMGGAVPPFPGLNEAQSFSSPPPPGRALTNSLTAGDDSSNMQRVMSGLRSAMPFVQRLLPLLDGNVASAIANLLVQHPQAPPPPPQIHLVPIEDGLADLHTQQRDLRSQVVEQNSSLKRVEDQLEMVREATDRNTLEQQELIEDLRTVGNKVNFIAILALGLLGVSILVNVLLYLHLKSVLP